jgi:hypothetical protein
MTRAYRWRCFACDEPNAASATSCSSCGFPATATGAEIARAQAAHRIGAAPLQSPDRPPAASLAQTLAPWRGWPMGVGIAGAILLGIGAYAGKNVLSWRGLGISVLTLMFGLALLMVAWAARKVTPRT